MPDNQKKYWVTSKLNSNTAEIFLYGYIDPYDVSAGDFIKELRQLEKDNANINVRINSGGGSVFEGLAIYNAIKQSTANIETYVDGLAASMASVIALAGNKVHMSKSAMMMTHQPIVGSYGNSEEHKKNAQLLDGLEQTMLAIYAGKTGKNQEDCKNSFLNGKDNWFNAEEAKAAGLADDIYDSPGIEAPAEKKDAKNVWQLYSKQQFAAKYSQTQKENMEQVKLSAASLAALNITAAVTDPTAIDSAIAALKVKADLADTLKAEKEAAEKKYNDHIAAEATAKVDSMITAAMTAKKINKETGDTLKADYANNPDGLKKILDGLAAYKPVSEQLKNEGAEGKLAELSAKSYSDLDKSGELPALKALSMDVFKAKFKEHYKVDYKGE